MGNYDEDYDFELEDRQRGKTQLDRYFATREAELAQRESELREREAETLSFLHSTEAKQAAEAARWRQVQLEITADMDGAAIKRLYAKHGI